MAACGVTQLRSRENHWWKRRGDFRSHESL